MAFPQVVGSATSSRASNDNPDTVTLPANIAAGDLIIAFHASDASVQRTWPSPWVEMLDNQVSGNTATMGTAYLIASGGETSVAVTKTVDPLERFSALAIRISAASWHGTTPPEDSNAPTQGDNANPNPTLVTASWGSADNLFIAVCAWDNSTGGNPVTVWPTNYSANNLQSPDISSAGRGAIGTRELAASNDDPGTFTITSDQWWADTIVVRPAAVAAGAWMLATNRGGSAAISA